MWTPIIEFLITKILFGLLVALAPVFLAFLTALAWKLVKYLSKKWELDISERQMDVVDNAVEIAVRAVEEQSKSMSLTSEQKEDLAVEKARGEIGEEVSGISLRDKIKAMVSRIFNREGNTKQ